MRLVTLSWAEFAEAANVGLLRWAISRGLGLHHKPETNGGWMVDLGNDIRGASAERAYAKYLNAHWRGGVNDPKDLPDVSNLQVRHTTLENGSLIIRPSRGDDLDALYGLCVGDPPGITIVGWGRGREVAIPKYLRDPDGRGPAYFIPQDALYQAP